MSNIGIEITEVDEVAPEILAQAISEIADGVKKLLNGPLRHDTLVLLIQNSCPGRPSRRVISEVLTAVVVFYQEVNCEISGI